MAGHVFDVAAVIAAAIAVAWMVWVVARPDEQRRSEDAARDFFDAHGHWPDEPDRG